MLALDPGEKGEEASPELAVPKGNGLVPVAAFDAADPNENGLAPVAPPNGFDPLDPLLDAKLPKDNELPPFPLPNGFAGLASVAPPNGFDGLDSLLDAKVPKDNELPAVALPNPKGFAVSVVLAEDDAPKEDEPASAESFLPNAPPSVALGACTAPNVKGLDLFALDPNENGLALPPVLVVAPNPKGLLESPLVVEAPNTDPVEPEGAPKPKGELAV